MLTKSKLMTEALTHPSVNSRKNYQRLELLGDRVLNMVVMEMLFHEYPNANEGELSRRLNHLVSGKVCAEIGYSLELPKQIIAQHALATQDGVVADVCEAIIGALYLEKGLQDAETFIRFNWGAYLEREDVKDPKMALQEWAQAKKWPRPEYRLQNQTGPEHDPTFRVEVVVGKANAQGVGKSKKAAEHQAAKMLLAFFTAEIALK